MTRPTVAAVDLEAVVGNFRAIADMLRRESAAAGRQRSPEVIAVVKANGYGHGAPGVAHALEEAGATTLACADLEEGAALRGAGIRVPILVFGALSISSLDAVFDYDLTPTVSTPGAARALSIMAAKRKTSVSCHLKVDTGMNRLGFRHDNLRRTMGEILTDPNVRVNAVYTHFATADDPESPFFDEQRRRFDRAVAALRAMGLGAVRLHAANSAALLRDTRVWYDAVRPGLLLYGIVPPPLATELNVKPALSLVSRVVAVKGVRPGEGVGYGLRWGAGEGGRTIAVVPAGYADGLDTRMSGRACALVRGRRTPIVGAVSMDMLALDVTGLDVDPGDEVVFIGSQGGETLTAREVAAAIGTIPWEVVCRLGSRIERRYEEVRSEK